MKPKIGEFVDVVASIVAFERDSRLFCTSLPLMTICSLVGLSRLKICNAFQFVYAYCCLSNVIRVKCSPT